MSSRTSPPRHSGWLRPLGLSLKGLALGMTLLSAAEAAEPMLPVQPSEPTGFFPTLNDMSVLRSQDYARSLGRSADFTGLDGPDGRLQTATDLFYYQDGVDPNFYQTHSAFFGPVDDVLGVFTPQDTLSYELESLDNTALTLDGRISALTRRYSPEQAHVKLGLLSFDVLWLGGGVVYSDFRGDQDFTGDDEDGWTGFIELAMRGSLRLTDTIHLTAIANLMYLPFENRLALRFGQYNEPSLLMRLNWSESYGAWDLLLFNEFRGMMGVDYYGDAETPELDRAGRYFYGFRDNPRANEFHNDEFVLFLNRAGFMATRPVFDEQWRLALQADHSDFWRTWDFEDHTKRDHIGAWLGYEGSLIPFAPRFVYDMFSYDGFESLWHRIEAQLTGRLTENLSWRGMAGYRYTTGTQRETDGFVWEAALDHQLTQSTWHSIAVGENFHDNEFMPETLTSRYARYTLLQRVNKSLFARLFGQFANNETVMDGWEERDRWSVGMSLVYNPLDFTSIIGTVLYDSADQIGSDFGDADRWLYRMEIQQQLGFRLTGRIFYQYEDRQSQNNGFSEHMTGMSVRRFF